MLIDHNKDWMNTPIKYGLTPAEHELRLELYAEQARQRARDVEAAEKMLLAVALALTAGAR